MHTKSVSLLLTRSAAPFWRGCSTRIERAPNAHRPRAVQDVRVNHRRRHVLVTQQLLDPPNIITRFEQVGGEAVPERVAARRLWDFGIANRLLDGLLDDGFVKMVVAPRSRSRIERKRGRRKYPLPARRPRATRFRAIAAGSHDADLLSSLTSERLSASRRACASRRRNLAMRARLEPNSPLRNAGKGCRACPP